MRTHHKSVRAHVFFHTPQHLLRASLAECAHHFAHVFKLFEQLVDVREGHATTFRNPSTPASIEQVRLGSLLGCHSADHGLKGLEIAFIHIYLLH